MTYAEVKKHYFEESMEFGLATKKQVERLSEWLDENGYHNAAHMRWHEIQQELRCELKYLMEEFA